MKKTRALSIETLGGLSVSLDGVFVVERGSAAKKHLALLTYLAVRRQNVHKSELGRALWGRSDRDGDLRTAVWTLRGELRGIVTGSGGFYAVAPDVGVTLDVFELERICVGAPSPEAFEAARTLYKGDFMTGYLREPFVRELSVKYRELFLRFVKRCLRQSEAADDPVRRLEISREALRFSPQDEELNFYKLDALLKLRMFSELEADFLRFESERRLAASQEPSERLHELYRLARSRGRGEKGLAEIRKEVISETAEDETGAHLCETDGFFEHCRLAKRQRGRGPHAVMLLMTLTKKGGRGAPHGVVPKCVEAIRPMLRSGDVVTQHSAGKLAVLIRLENVEYAPCPAYRAKKILAPLLRSENLEIAFSYFMLGD